LKEERRLRVFDNRVLRKSFEPKRNEVTKEWGRLHNGELYDMYSSPNIIRVTKSRRMRWGGGGMCKLEEQKMCIQSFGGETCWKEATLKT
jgi:hypothetical protein